MRKIIQLDARDLTPTPAEVLASQGMGGRASIPGKIKSLIDSALELFGQLAEPHGLVQKMPVSEFGAIYDGNGLNSPEGPVPGIVSRADGLALFSATLGNPLIAKTSELFATGGPALGFMLDAVNTCAAELLGRQMCLHFLEILSHPDNSTKHMKAQYYCPGHCGWHLSGQAKVFQALHPEEIGITLNASWVMNPFKSISGIIAAGEMDIHRFQPAFSFCSQCKEHKCVKRLLLLENEN